MRVTSTEARRLLAQQNAGTKLARKIQREEAWAGEMARLPGVFVRVKTVNELNDHSFWRNRHTRSKQQHAAMAQALPSVRKPALPCRVRFTRYSTGSTPLDTDGAFAAMKFVRDAVAKWLGVDDGGAEVEWVWPVGQETNQPGFGVRVEFLPPRFVVTVTEAA